MTPIEQLWTHISGIMTGYSVRYFYLSDRDHSGRLCVIRPAGGGQPVPAIMGTPVFQVWLVGSAADQLANYQKCQDIINLIGSNWSSGGVAGFRVLSEPQGPFLLDQDRHFFEINIDALLSRS